MFRFTSAIVEGSEPTGIDENDLSVATSSDELDGPEGNVTSHRPRIDLERRATYIVDCCVAHNHSTNTKFPK